RAHGCAPRSAARGLQARPGVASAPQAPHCARHGDRSPPMNRKAVLVTGGAKRIGAAISRRFGAAGWHVVVHCCRSFAEAQALAGELPSAEVVRCDLADGDAAVALVEELAQRLGDWRVLLSSASVFRPDSVSALDPGVSWEAMQVNARTPAMMAQAFL